MIKSNISSKEKLSICFDELARIEKLLKRQKEKIAYNWNSRSEWQYWLGYSCTEGNQPEEKKYRKLVLEYEQTIKIRENEFQELHNQYMQKKREIESLIKKL